MSLQKGNGRKIYRNSQQRLELVCKQVNYTKIRTYYTKTLIYY